MVKLFRLIILLQIVLFQSVSPSRAQTEPPISLSIEQSRGLILFANIGVGDEVSDGCWTNSRAVKALVRLKFERDGIAVLNERPAFYSPSAVRVFISATGIRTGSGVCATMATLEMGRPSYARWGGFDGSREYSFSGWMRIFEQRSIFTSAGNNNDQIVNFVDESMDILLADIISMRRSDTTSLFFQNYPWMRDTPLTKEEWEEIKNSADK